MIQASLPLVTLSIVSHGDAEKISRLLKSLRTFEQDGQFQVILTDNLGDDLASFDISTLAAFKIIRNQHPRGYGWNHNQAFRLAETRYFCILNPDVVFEQEVFGQLIAFLETGKADIAAPLIIDSNAVVQDSFRALPKPWDIVRRRLPGYHPILILPDADGMVRPDWMAGIFLLMRTETYLKLKGFDERYRLYFEDVDLCTRARLAGLKLLVDPSVRIRHDAQRTSSRNYRYLFWHIQSAFRFYTSPVYRQVRQIKASSTGK